jgi:hypothetical protein
MNTLKRRQATPPASRWSVLVVGCAALLGSSVAQAGWFDGLLAQGQAPATSANAKQRIWQIHEFTRIELTTREAGAEPNQHPATVSPEALRQQLAQVQFTGRNGAQALFSADEAGELAGPLAQALGRAGPGDDVLLLSSARREGDIFVSPMAITARLFVQAGKLQFIVHDARFEFYDVYRGTQTPPLFHFGSRSTAGAVSVQSAGATNPRADWLAIPLQATPAPSGQPAAALPATVVAPPPAAPARKALDAPAADDIERRLETLKRLREKNLITEDEYQQKRKEILQLL